MAFNERISGGKSPDTSPAPGSVPYRRENPQGHSGAESNRLAYGIQHVTQPD
jgi:hypothetical protein